MQGMKHALYFLLNDFTMFICRQWHRLPPLISVVCTRSIIIIYNVTCTTLMSRANGGKVLHSWARCDILLISF